MTIGEMIGATPDQLHGDQPRGPPDPVFAADLRERLVRALLAPVPKEHPWSPTWPPAPATASATATCPTSLSGCPTSPEAARSTAPYRVSGSARAAASMAPSRGHRPDGRSVGGRPARRAGAWNSDRLPSRRLRSRR